MDGNIFALSTEDGRTLWKRPTNGRIVPNTLVALDQLTGQEKWRFSDPSRPKMGMNATASASGNKVFITTTVDHHGMPCGGRLFCLNDETGKLLWQYTGAGGWTGSSCTPDTVISGSSTDVFLSCFATESNKDDSPRLLWRTRVDGIFQESIPAIHGDPAFILCSDGYLYGIQ